MMMMTMKDEGMKYEEFFARLIELNILNKYTKNL